MGPTAVSIFLSFAGVSRGELRRPDLEFRLTGWRAEYVTRRVLGSNPSVLPAIGHRRGVATSAGAANFLVQHRPDRALYSRVASERVRGPSGRRDDVNPAGPVVIAWRRHTTTAPESAHEVGCPGLTPGGRTVDLVKSMRPGKMKLTKPAF